MYPILCTSIIVVLLACAHAVPVSYNAATNATARYVYFPVARFGSVTGTASSERYRSFVNGRVSRLQQSIEFRSPTSDTNSSMMNVSVYVRYFAPSLLDNASNGTLRIYLAKPAAAMTDDVRSVAARNPLASSLSNLEPSLTRELVLTCELPSAQTLGNTDCVATPYFCGEASLTFPTTLAASTSPMGSTQLLVASMTTDLLTTKTSLQDAACTSSVEVAVIWDTPSVVGVTFRSPVPHTSNVSYIQPDVVLLTSVGNEAAAMRAVQYQFAPNSDPQGYLLTPLLVDDNLRSSFPRGSLFSRVALTNYSAASEALLTPIGVTCTIDDSLIPATEPNGNWEMSCVMPLKNAIFGRLLMRLPDPFNATTIVNGIRFTLESTANLTLPSRDVLCSPMVLPPPDTSVAGAPCRMYAACTPNDIYFGSADGTGQRYTQLRMTWSPSTTGFVPSMVVDNTGSDGSTCNAALTAVLTYTAISTSSSDFGSANCRADQYECAVDKRCISNQQLCDNVVDCSDGSDERSCDDWVIVRTAGTFPLCPNAVSPTSQEFINTYLTCLKTAQANSAIVGGLRYTVNEFGDAACEYFHINCVRQQSADAIANNFSSTTTTSIVLLQLSSAVRSSLKNDACSTIVSCNGKGSATNVSAASVGWGCACTCFDGFEGADCSSIRTFSVMDGIWLQLSGSGTVNALLLQSIQTAIPELGDLWVTFAYYRSSDNTTRILLGLDEPNPLLDSTIVSRLGTLPSFQSTMAAYDSPVTLSTDAPHCTIDDTTRDASCTYFRTAFDRTVPFEVLITAYAPLVVTTIEVKGYLENGTETISRMCTVPEKLQVPDLSYDFLKGEAPQRIQESWCPQQSTCLIGTVPNDTIAFRLSFVLPIGMNSTQLDVRCNGVPHFDDATILPQVVLLPPANREIDIPRSNEPYVIEETSSTPIIVLFVIMLFIAVTSFLLWMYCRRKDDHLMEVARSVAESRLAMFKMGLMAGEKLTDTFKWAIRVVSKAERGPDVAWYLLPRRHIALWVTFTFLFGGLSVILVAYFFIAPPTLSSNYQIVMEYYREPQCNMSVIDSDPFSTSFISASGSCETVVVLGKPFQELPQFMSGKCGPGDTSSSFSFAALVPGFGTTGSCNDPAVVVPLDTCSPLRFASGAVGGYVMVRCESRSDLQSVKDDLTTRLPVRLYESAASITVPLTQAAAEGLTSSSASTDDSYAGQQVPPFSAVNPFSVTDPLSGVAMMQYYYMDSSTGTMRYSSTSASVGYLLSTAVGDTTSTLGPSSIPKELLVSQLANELLSTTVVTDVRSYEANIPDAARFLPRTALYDLPIGRFFNGYASYPGGGDNISESSDHRMWERLFFPGIMSQDADIGGDGEATVAFWMRAGRTSRGFAVASTDNIRNDEFVSPLLERLERMIIAGAMNSDTWFTVEWSVYWAVFIDGYAQRIYFVAAGAPNGDRVGFSDSAVFQTVWDAQQLGITRLFTNRWHHVAIVVEIPDNVDESGVGVGLQLRLVVDGETYSGHQGFLKCLPRQLDYISPLWNANVPDPQNMKLTQGGTLIVGNINAGLYGVLVTSVALSQSDIIALGTLPMNNFFNLNSAQFFALGFYVTFIGVSLLCMMSVGIVVEYVSERRKRMLGEATAADLAYMSVVGTTLSSEKFRIGGRDFHLFQVDILRAILGLDVSVFAKLLTEIEKLAQSSDAAKADLMAIVWIRGQEEYTPSNPQLKAIRDQLRTAEKADLSQGGHFFVPQLLWQDFVMVLTEIWEQQLERRVVDDEDLKKQAQTGKKMVVKVAKVKVSKGGKAGGKGGGKGGAKGGRKGASVRKLSNSIKINAAAPLQMIQPVILALQSASAYLKNFLIPVQYQFIFNDVFTFFTFNWLAVPTLPDLFMAFFVFAVGIATTTMLFFFCLSDHDEWLRFVGLYAAKRDRLDKAKIKAASDPPKTKSQKKQLLVALGNQEDLEDDDLFNGKYVGLSDGIEMLKGKVESDEEDGETNTQPSKIKSDNELPSTPHTMPVGQANWYDPMLRNILPLTITIPFDEFVDGSRRSNLIQVRRKDLVPAVCPKKRLRWEIEYDSASQTYVTYDAENRDEPPLPLNDLGYLCPLHRSILCEMDQVDACVKPYQCFAVLHGNRCTMQEGTMFCCRSRMPDGKFCPYSVCDVHFRSTAMQLIKVSAKTGLMEIFGEGLSAFLAFVAISLTGVIYFPVVQTCLQFLICDPQYQCIFPHCWGDADADFLLAASIVILMLALVGVGMPVIMYWELRRRKKVLFALFYRKEYFKVYLAIDEDAMEEVEERERKARLSMFATDREDPTAAAGIFGTLAKFFSKTITGETIEETITENHEIIRKTTVDFGEWERFLAGDNSALGQLLYKFIEYEYLTLPPFLMLYRVAVLVPTVFVTDDLFIQMTALAIVEVGFGVFIFWTEPYINPWIDTMYRAGSVHNILLIGLAAINTMLNAEGSTTDLSNLMLAVTFVYFSIVVGLLVLTTVWPTLAVALTKSDVAHQLKRIGMRTIDMSSVILNPFIHRRVFVSIVDVLRSYERFGMAHPEADPGDDINSRGEPDVEDIIEVTKVAPTADDDSLVNHHAGGTVGEGLLGPLAGLPQCPSRQSNRSPAQQDERAKTPQRTPLAAVLDIVVGNHVDDPEDDLQEGEFDDD